MLHMTEFKQKLRKQAFENAVLGPAFKVMQTDCVAVEICSRWDLALHILLTSISEQETQLSTLPEHCDHYHLVAHS